MEYFREVILSGRIVFDDHVCEKAVSLIRSMLMFVPEKRISLVGVFAHPWISAMKLKYGRRDFSEISK